MEQEEVYEESESGVKDGERVGAMESSVREAEIAGGSGERRRVVYMSILVVVMMLVTMMWSGGKKIDVYSTYQITRIEVLLISHDADAQATDAPCM